MKVTMADIAKRANVAISTVYRALNDQPGVGKRKQQEILEIAKEMGYSDTYQATSIRRGLQRIAVAVSEDPTEIHVTHCIYQGATKYLEHVPNIEVELIHLPYQGRELGLHARMQEILDGTHGEVHGMIAFGAAVNSETLPYPAFAKSGIPLVFIGEEGRREHRIGSIMPESYMAGRMVAELVTRFASNHHFSKALIIGDFRGTSQQQNAMGFEKENWKKPSPMEILKLSNSMEIPLAKQKESLHRLLTITEDLGSIYCCNAWGTALIIEVLKELDLLGKIFFIGTDISKDNIRVIRSKEMNALIHNRPIALGYEAMRCITTYLLTGETVTNDVRVIDPVIVMASNLDFYLREEGMECGNR